MDQTSQMRHFASQSEADKYAISQEIASLQGDRVTRLTAPAISKRLAELQTRLDALDAPIYKLPDDVIAEIFRIGWSLELDEHRTSHHFAVTASHIASRFRYVALTTPSIWTDIRVVLDNPGIRMVMLDTMARRAASLPIHLELRMRIGAHYPPAFHMAQDAMADSLMAISSRVESMYIRNWAAASEWPGRDKTRFLALFRACPLERFELDGRFPAPGSEAEELWPLVKEQPHLKALKVDDVFPPARQDRVQLASLRSVTFGYNGLRNLLAGAKIPNVSHITLDGTQLNPLWTTSNDNLQQSVPALRVLTLRRRSFTRHSNIFLIPLVSAVPSLEELHIIHGSFLRYKPPKFDDIPVEEFGHTPVEFGDVPGEAKTGNPKLKLLRLAGLSSAYEYHAAKHFLHELLVSGQGMGGPGTHLELRDGTLDLLGCPPVDGETQTWLKKCVGRLTCYSDIDNIPAIRPAR